jgi:hypothetical protein
MTLLPRITVAQAKKIQCDLIDVLFDSKRQMPYAYNIAAGNFTWDATDGTVAGMSIATIPQLIQNLTGTSDSTVVGKLNTLVDEINAKIVNPGNQLKGEINSNAVNPGNALKNEINSSVINVGNALKNEINSNVVSQGNALTTEINNDIVTPTYNGFNSINGVFAAVNSQIVTPGNSLAYHLDMTVLGDWTTDAATGGGPNTLNNKLRHARGYDEATYGSDASPGLGGNIAHSGVSFTNIGTNPNQVASIETGFAALTTTFVAMTATFVAMTATFGVIGYASTTPDPSIAPIQWTPIGQANPVTLTATEMAGLMSGITTRRNNLLTTKFNKIAAVNALTEIADVIAYDVTTGWPS